MTGTEAQNSSINISMKANVKAEGRSVELKCNLMTEKCSDILLD